MQSVLTNLYTSYRYLGYASVGFVICSFLSKSWQRRRSTRSHLLTDCKNLYINPCPIQYLWMKNLSFSYLCQDSWFSLQACMNGPFGKIFGIRGHIPTIFVDERYVSSIVPKWLLLSAWGAQCCYFRYSSGGSTVRPTTIKLLATFPGHHTRLPNILTTAAWPSDRGHLTPRN